MGGGNDVRKGGRKESTGALTTYTPYLTFSPLLPPCSLPSLPSSLPLPFHSLPHSLPHLTFVFTLSLSSLPPSSPIPPRYLPAPFYLLFQSSTFHLFRHVSALVLIFSFFLFVSLLSSFVLCRSPYLPTPFLLVIPVTHHPLSSPHPSP